MWLLIIYIFFVVVGAVVSAGIGFYVEKEFSSTVGLIVFLTLFFANFVTSWFITIGVVNRFTRLSA
jgi:hypothetical protein